MSEGEREPYEVYPERKEKKEAPLIIQYTQLLQRHMDPNHPKVRAFVEQHKDDDVFVQRAGTLNRLYAALKRSL